MPRSALVEEETNAVGVDSDAELQALMLVEQAYTANAKVLSVIEPHLTCRISRRHFGARAGQPDASKWQRAGEPVLRQLKGSDEPHGGRIQRVAAQLVAREVVAIDDEDSGAGTGQQERRNGSGGTRAGDQDV